MVVDPDVSRNAVMIGGVGSGIICDR